MTLTTSEENSLFILSQAKADLTAAIDLIAVPLDTVEKQLQAQATFFERGIEKYISYACGGHGKRLRPILVLLAGGATGPLLPEHTNLAIILELIHIASLVHDDIMDGAKVRRERPTLNAKWGNAVTVLVGDLLFAHALKMATHFSKGEVCRRIADAALGLCTGEILQTEHRFDVDLPISDYYRMVEMKTASLFSTACELGAILNDASPEIVAILQKFGNNLGIAYQIFDDCVDFMGDEQNQGKTLGTDFLGGKFTLPILLLLQKVSLQEQQEIRKLLLAHEQENALYLTTLLRKEGALQETLKKGRELIEEAEESLMFLPKNPYVTGLHHLASYMKGLFCSMDL